MAKFYQYRSNESGGCERREIDPTDRTPLGEWGKTDCPPGYPPTSNQGTTQSAGNGTIILNVGKRPIYAKKVDTQGATDNDLIISSDQLEGGRPTSNCNCSGSSSGSSSGSKTYNFTPMGIVIGLLLFGGISIGVYNLFFSSSSKPSKA